MEWNDGRTICMCNPNPRNKLRTTLSTQLNKQTASQHPPKKQTLQAGVSPIGPACRREGGIKQKAFVETQVVIIACSYPNDTSRPTAPSATIDPPPPPQGLMSSGTLYSSNTNCPSSFLPSDSHSDSLIPVLIREVSLFQRGVL